MWNIMIDFPHVGPRQWEELTVLPKDWNRDRLKELKHIKEVQKQLKNAPPEGEESSSPFPLPNPPSTSTRYWADRGKVSLEFLQKEGKCQDHIRPDISKIPHAGRGGFASRDLPKGTVVGYSPLIQVAVKAEQAMEVIYNGESEHGMDRFEFRDVGYDQIEDLDELIESASTHKNRYSKQDLVVNYSFGHRNSTLLLTPYGGMVNYINHKSAHDGDGPNVRVQWPDREMVAHKPDWLGKDLDFLRDSIDKIGLSFDYIALRDIKEGEEITMDYGDEWVSSFDCRFEWNQYLVLSWLSSISSACHHSISPHMNFFIDSYKKGQGLERACRKLGPSRGCRRIRPLDEIRKKILSHSRRVGGRTLSMEFAYSVY
jgi:hypothetical protein